jgi:hypothetical protein
MNPTNDPPIGRRITPSYKPPELPKAEKERSALYNLAKNNMEGYANRTHSISTLIRTVNHIVSTQLGSEKDLPKVIAGDKECKKFLSEQKEGTAFFIKTELSEAYRFLSKNIYFHGTSLDKEALTKDLEDLQRKAQESQLTAQLFKSIHANAEFKSNPKEYLDSWRHAITETTAAERKVLKRFDTSTCASGYDVENTEDLSANPWCPNQ